MPSSKKPLAKRELNQRDLIAKEIQDAVENESLPHIYFNGFANTLSTGDVLILLKQNNKSVAVLNTSYTVAKTLVQKLGNVIVELESKTGNTIMTTDDIGKMAEADDNE